MGKSKFKYKSIVYDGHTFKSTIEYNRYIELKVLENSGKISNLKLQPEFELFPKEIIREKNYPRIKYTSDFEYIDCNTNKRVIEEIKSVATAKEKDYKLRIRIFIDKYIKDSDLVFIETIIGENYTKSKPRKKSLFKKLFKTTKKKTIKKI